jgi:hypothetical protein
VNDFNANQVLTAWKKRVGSIPQTLTLPASGAAERPTKNFLYNKD